MSDTHSHDDHWRRLAEELGLDVGPAPEQPSHPAPPARIPDEPAPPSAWREAAEHDEPPHSRDRHFQRAEPPMDIMEDVPEPTDIEEPPQLRVHRERPVPDDELFPAEVDGDDTEIESVDAAPSEIQTDSESAETDEQTGKRRRRRRSRRKKKGEPGAEAGADGGVERPAGESAESNADDEEEPTAEVVRNWNVPSWDELIASLHRPER
jgi:hypothetical protein